VASGPSQWENCFIALRRVKAVAADLFSPYQFGVGIPNGCEKIIHSLQHVLTDGTSRQMALQLDISNAFNSCDRAKLLEKLYNSPELAPIWRMVTFGYATSSPLLLQNCPGQHIASNNGVRQGDPLSSLLFCLYIKDALEDVAHHASVHPYGFMDDVTVVGTPDQAMTAFSRLQQTLPTLGLHLNTAKSLIAYFHNDIAPLTPAVVSVCQKENISIQHHSFRTLGAVIAADENNLSTALRDAMATDFSMTPFFRRLASGNLPLSAHCSFSGSVECQR
jgi:hypothetical protein